MTFEIILVVLFLHRYLKLSLSTFACFR